jgi:TRAP-type C4-dicarboxylate transport system substrate-binding protein
VLPQLNTGAVNIVVAPALAAEQLQWASKLDHIVSNTSGFAIGALVMSTKSLDALPADLRQIVTDTGKVAAAALTTRIRNEDAAAFTRMKGKMTVVTLTGEEEAKWDSLFKQVRARLAQGTFSPELVSKLEGLAQ